MPRFFGAAVAVSSGWQASAKRPIAPRASRREYNFDDVFIMIDFRLRTFLGLGICLLARRRPLHGVDKDAPHLGAVIVVVSLVSGREVEDFAFADDPAKAH